MKDDILALAERISHIASEKKAEGIVIVDVEGLCSYADALVVCHGRSTRQSQTIANFIQASLKSEGRHALGVEGNQQGNWVLVDYGDIVVHVFYQPVREFYGIEAIWPEAKVIKFEPAD